MQTYDVILKTVRLNIVQSKGCLSVDMFPTCVIKSMNHISLINVRKIFFFKYLDVQVLFTCNKKFVVVFTNFILIDIPTIT